MKIDAEGLLAARTAFIAALEGEDGLYHGWQDDRGIDTEDYSIDGGFNLNEALRAALSAYLAAVGSLS
jgi:hypothetical protein